MARHLTPRDREQRHVIAIARRPPTDYGAALVVVWLASPSKRRRRGGERSVITSHLARDV